MKKAPKQREPEDARHELDRQRRLGDLPLTKPEEPLCHDHDWNPAPPFPGAPRPPKAECPGCLAAKSYRRPQEDVPQVVVAHPADRPSHRLDVMYADLEASREREHRPEPGSFDAEARRLLRRDGDAWTPEAVESLALEFLDEQRAEDLERERRRGRQGRAVYSKIENGQFVTTRAIPTRGRKWAELLVRSTP